MQAKSLQGRLNLASGISNNNIKCFKLHLLPTNSKYNHGSLANICAHEQSAIFSPFDKKEELCYFINFRDQVQ